MTTSNIVYCIIYYVTIPEFECGEAYCDENNICKLIIYKLECDEWKIMDVR